MVSRTSPPFAAVAGRAELAGRAYAGYQPWRAASGWSTAMSFNDLVVLVTGILSVAVGLGYLFSARFTGFAMNNTAQGVFWTRLLGERWSALAAKFVFS